jgi:hypothetical protein
VLVAEPQSADFGRHPAWEGREATFRVRNLSPEPVLLTKVRVSCGCSEASLATESLAPGGDTALTVRLKPNSLRGPYTKHVFLHWRTEGSSSASGVLRVAVRGEARPLLTVRPETTVALGRFAAGVPVARALEIRAGDVPVEFGVPGLPEGVSMELGKTALGAGEALPLPVTVRAGKAGIYRGVVSIPVKVPEGHPPVEIVLHGTAEEP